MLVGTGVAVGVGSGVGVAVGVGVLVGEDVGTGVSVGLAGGVEVAVGKAAEVGVASMFLVVSSFVVLLISIPSHPSSRNEKTIKIKVQPIARLLLRVNKHITIPSLFKADYSITDLRCANNETVWTGTLLSDEMFSARNDVKKAVYKRGKVERNRGGTRRIQEERQAY